LRAEIVSVGTELLLGQIVNTHASFLGRELAELGIDLHRIVTVGDNLERAAAVLREARERAELTVATGGLGPTQDDLTAQALAKAWGLPLEEHPGARSMVETFFRRRGRQVPAANRQQYLLPRGAEALPNPHGTAPGVWLEAGGRLAVLLPGPPGELVPMFREQVAPRLAGRGGAVIRSRVLHVLAMGEPRVEEALDGLLGGGNPTLAPLVSGGAVHLRLTAKAPDQAAAAALLAPLEAAVRQRLGPRVWGADEETLEEVLGRRLRGRGLSLALGESCTGGLVAHRLTQVPGSSEYLLLSVVAYAVAAKERLLGVDGSLVRREGVVSAAVAVRMAQGARQAVGADIGLGVTGYAGPAGGPEGPAGLVFGALADAAGVVTRRWEFPGLRVQVKERAAQELLTLLYRRLEGF
jgi:nicotinamide-nucleotide amidase